MTDILLNTPPVVLQQARHICWAAAYESWALAQNVPADRASAAHMVDVLYQIGRGDDHSHPVVLDTNERIHPDGLGAFMAMAEMTIRLVRPHSFSVAFLRGQLGRGHVWLWGTPRHGNIAHVVVVFGISDAGEISYMDPLVGIRRVPLHDLRHRMRMFAVGTRLRDPLLLVRPGNPWAGMTTAQPGLAMPPADPYAALRTPLMGQAR